MIKAVRNKINPQVLNLHTESAKQVKTLQVNSLKTPIKSSSDSDSSDKEEVKTPPPQKDSFKTPIKSSSDSDSSHKEEVKTPPQENLFVSAIKPTPDQEEIENYNENIWSRVMLMEDKNKKKWCVYFVTETIFIWVAKEGEKLPERLYVLDKSNKKIESF